MASLLHVYFLFLERIVDLGFLDFPFLFITAGGYPESFFMLLFVVFGLPRSHVGYIGTD
jgi:hypothetical protein